MLDVDFATFAGLVFGLCYLAAVPLAALWLFGRRMKLAPWNVILGAASFLIVFELLSALNPALLELASRAALAKSVTIAVLFTMTIAVSVAPRWLALRFLAARSSGPDAGVAFGIGYGGCEIFMRLLLPKFDVLKLAIRANSGDLPLSLTNSEAFARVLDSAWADSLGKAMIAIVFLLVEVAVSTVVWTGVRDRRPLPVFAASGLLAAYLLPMYLIVGMGSQAFDCQSIFNCCLGLLIVAWLASGRSLPVAWGNAPHMPSAPAPAAARSRGFVRVWSDQRRDREASD